MQNPCGKPSSHMTETQRCEVAFVFGFSHVFAVHMRRKYLTFLHLHFPRS